MFKLSRQQKDHRYFCGNKYEKYSIKKLKVGAASVLVGTGFLFGYNLDQVKADEQKTETATVIPKAGDTPQSANKVEDATEPKQEKAPEVGTETPKSGTKEETVPATSPQVAETNETSSTKEIPAIKETPATKEVPENKANKVDKEIVNSSTLREKLADLEAQIERIRGNKKQASQIQNAEKLLAEAKKFLESSATSQKEVDAKVKEISSLTNILKSIKAEETPKINKNQDRRNGKMLRNGTGFRIGAEGTGDATTTGIGADVVDAKEDATVTRPPYTERTVAEGLAKQIAWLDFADERNWTNVDKENGNIYLKEGSVYEKEIMPHYRIKLTVKSLKPFQATEIYRKRMEDHGATAEEKATFNPNATNGLIDRTDNTRVRITAQAQDEWSEIKNNGIDTRGRKTSIIAERTGANIGIQFAVSGTYKGKPVSPAVVMADAESANRGEIITFTTNGSGWRQIIDLEKNRADARRYKPLNYYTDAYKNLPDSAGNEINANSIYNVGNGNKIVPKFFTNPDQETGGLGSGVFGPGLTARSYSVPVVMTKNATEVGMYVFSTGSQAAMMGVLPLDEGDAPETYGEATHTMNRRNGLDGTTVKQPYLGSERPDADNKVTKNWHGDDDAGTADEGIKQLLPESLKESEGNIIKANISNSGYYTLNIQAHTGGAEKAYIRSWIDFNGDGDFDEDEASDIAEITQDGDVKLHFKNKTQKDAGKLLEAGTRVRIATSKDEIMNPTGLAFSGEVEDFHAKITRPPKGEKKTTIGEIKEKQSTTVHFTPKGKNVYRTDDVDAEIDTTVPPVYINNKTGKKITLSDENTYTVKGQGTYKFTPNGPNVDVEFTPAKGFVGKAHGITIRRQDTNKTTTDWGTNDDAVEPNVNDVLNTMDGLYIPEVRIPTVQPTPNNAESRNIQGFAQKGTPTFTVETSDAPVTASVKHPARLIDPRTNALANSAIVDALDPNNNKVGTYKIAPETGEVTFTPNINYRGEVKPVKVSVPVVVAHDKDDKDITVDTEATYTPRITPVTPTAEASTTRDVQGKAQVSRIVFDTVENNADKNQTVNFDKSPEVGTDGEHVDLDKETLTLVNASGVETNTVTTDQGEYVLDKVSKTITFTPKKTFVGTATAVNIRIKDMNGTKVETTYTPTVIEVTPTGKDSATSGPQGLTQKSPILFNEREETDGKTLNFDTGHERVALKPETLTLLNGTAKVKSITVENVGTYELVDNVITFTPAPTYHGTAEGVNVQVEDENGKVVTKKYVPTVTELTVTPEGKTTKNIQGETQEGTPTFTIPAESTNATVTSRKLVDPADPTNTPKDTVTLDGKGTFTIDGNGKVTFVPVPTYKEDVPPITVKATVTITNAKNESTTITSTASYKPIIVPAEIDKEPATSTNLQGLVQTGTPTFTPKTIEVDGVQKTISVQANSYKLVKDGLEKDTLPAYKAGTTVEIGTYTINPQNGTVTFTPTDKTYTGAVQPVDVQATGSNGVKVHTTYTPTITPVTPTKEPSATTDVQGKKQVSRIVLDTVETDADKDKTVNFNKGSETGANGERVNLNPDTLTLLNDAGDEVSTLTTNDGKYELDKANKTITFTPNKNFVGPAKAVKVQIKDANGTKVETTYTPTVTDVTMTSEDKESSAPQGKTQTGTPTFTVSTPEVRITGYKLLNPTGNTPVEGNEIEVPNEGTYRINPTTGQVTFIPKPGFTGPATGITVQATDENGETKDAKYKPKVTALIITPQPATTTNIQGETQEGTPTFPVPAESNNVTVTSRKLVDPTDQTEKDSVKVEGKGTFTIDGNGKVTFTPLPTYKGDVDPITVKATVIIRNDKNESTTISSTTTYKPIIVSAEIDKEPATSTNLQGLTQTGTPTFKSKTVDVNGTPKTITVQPNSYKLVNGGAESNTLPAYKAGTTDQIGTYTIDSATGQVTFTPSDKTYSGEVAPVSVQATGSNGVKVETTYTPIITPVTPTGTNTTSSGLQGKVQTGKPVFNGGVPEVPMNDEVPATLEGADQDGKVVIAGKGTYTVAKDGTVTFTPDKNFVGVAPAVTVKRVDKNGTIATATYTPTVKDVTMESENKTSEALQGKTQTGTPTFTISTPDVRITEYKLIDPTNNTPVEEVEVGNQGTYSIDKVTGEVTFVPKPGFTGPTTGITVRATDENGETKDATYTPSVTPLKVTPENKSTMNIQGLPQEATPTFKLPKRVTNAVVTERKLIVPGTKTLTDSVTVDGKGTFTINANGKVTFTPVPSYVGDVPAIEVQGTITVLNDNNDKTTITSKASYKPIIVPIELEKTPADSTEVQGLVQKGTPKFTSPESVEINGVEKTVTVKPNSYKLVKDGKETDSIPAYKKDTQEVIGKYTIDSQTGEVTFTPTDKTYTGEVEPATVQATGSNNVKVQTTYTPIIKPVKPVGTNAGSEGIQGAQQSGTPSFKSGNENIPMTVSTTNPAKLVVDGQPVADTTIPAKDDQGQQVGTYTIEPATGKVTFIPNPGFSGTPVPATVQAKDGNGTPTTATYTPVVKAAVPSGDNQVKSDIQGAKQTVTPVFTPGKNTVNNQEVSVPFEATSKAKLIDPSKTGEEREVTTLVVENQGTYTIDDNGVVTFTPLPTFKGEATAVSIVRKDKNGTPATATFKPNVVGVTPSATAATTTKVQGSPQESEVTFTAGKATIGTVEKTVPMDPAAYKLLGGQEGKTPLDTVPAMSEDGTKQVGTYTIKVVEGKPVVTFTPTDKAYAGKLKPVTVQGKDTNGTEATTTYTPVITPIVPTSENGKSEGPQGVEQKGSVTFKPGKEPGTENTPVAIDKTKMTLLGTDGNPVESLTVSKDGKVIGTYTLVKDPNGVPTGEVKFVPSDKLYVGEVPAATVQVKDANGTVAKATYTPILTEVNPTSKPSETTGFQGLPQTSRVVLDEKDEADNTTVNFDKGNDKVALVPSTLTLVNADGAKVTSVTVPNEGTYELNNGVITFTPLPTFHGKASGVSVQAEDVNGKVAKTTYTPTVTEVRPVGTNAGSEGIQGAQQSGTPSFKSGNENIPMTVSATNPAKLVDPTTKQPIEATEIDAKNTAGEKVGKYTIDPATGKVTFTPNPGFSGTPVPATVQAKDGNGTPTTATYTPVVKAAVPSGDNQVRSDIQGAKQTATPVFTPGKNTVNNQEVSVPFEATSKAKLIDPSKTGEEREVTTLVVENQGTYTIDDNGVVTFTPLPTFKGEATPVSIVRKDKNGTPATATFKPNVVGVTPSATEATTTKVQGATQETPVTFTPGKATIGTAEKSVPMDPNAYKLLGGQEGKTPLDTVPAMSEDGTKQVGTYTIKVVDGKPVVTFTPTDKTYAGKLKPVTVQGKDTNGTEATTTYTPVITPIVPTAENGTSEGPQGVEQTGRVTFKPGKEPGTENTPVAIDKTKMTLLGTDGNPVESLTVSKDGKEIGTYTLVKDPSGLPTGEVKFTPTDKSYVGEVPPATVQVKDANGTPATATYTPTFTEVNPTGKDSATTGLQGFAQKSPIVFNQKDEEDKTTVNFNAGHEKVTLKQDTLTLVNAAGDKVTTVTVPDVGTYELKDGVITFTPLKTFKGRTEGVTVQVEDANGKVVKQTYVPNVVEVLPTGKDTTSIGLQGKVQTGKPEFTPGSPEVPMDDESPATFEDGNITKTVDKVGTYTVAKDGTVTFTPNKDFSGEAPEVTVKRVDKNGTAVTAKYKPTVTKVTPTGKDTTSTGLQGKVQTGTPVFTPGNPEVPMDDEVPATFDNGQISKTVDKVGTYTVAKDGTVTFTPDKEFVGEAPEVTVKRVDKNGTAVTAKYKPIVAKVLPTGESSETEGAKGKPQTSAVIFDKKDEDKSTVNFNKGDETVALNPSTLTLVDKNGNPSTEVKVPGEGTYTLANNVITFTPEKDFAGKATGVTVQVKDINGTSIEKTYTPTVRAVTTFVDPSGNPITVDKNNKPVQSEVDGSKQPTKDIYGYKFVRTETDNKGNTKHIYEQAEGKSVKVTYVSTTGETLSDSQTVETKDKFIGTDYDASIEALKLERIEKDGKVYLLKERKADSASENGKLSDQEQTVTYVYEEVKEPASNQKYGNVVVVYKDKFGRPISGTTESGKEVASTEIDTPSSPLNTEYDTTDHKPQTITTKDGKKYKLIKVLKTSDAEKSGVKARTSVITYVYEMLDNTAEYPEAHIGLVLVNYLDEEGNPISGKTPEGKVVPNMVVDTEADLVGKDYDTTDHKVSTIIVENGDVYELLKVSESSVEKGKLTEGATNVNYIYHKVVTKFVDENGKEIKSPEKGRTDKKDIPEYTFKETKKDVNGNTVHVYTKKSSSTPVTPTPTPSTPSTEKETLYVDANGKPLQPAKKGQHPQDKIPGYEFVRTETDANGNVRHLYRKIQSTIPVEPVQPTAPTMPEQPAQPEVPTSPAQPVQPTEVKEVEAKRELPNTGTEDQASLAALGLLGALSGFGLLASKKKED